MPIIQVKNVTKDYKLGQMTSFKDSLHSAWASLCGRSVPVRKPFHALDDVSFSIEAGEVVGIIGTNGAGKSTLLKLISGITNPTSGQCFVNGKITPLIEVGAGLHPELTGRENVFLNASILGVPRSVIRKKLDEIVSFAELDEFIDTPVKRYSSGMMIRLGFSIATSLEADILIVDEVLAVGDLAFQRKCFDRMENLIKGQGRTVLIVSHNIRQIARMCSRVIFLDHGAIKADGETIEICDAFYEHSNKRIVDQRRSDKICNDKILMSGEVALEELILLDKDGNSVDDIFANEACTIRCIFNAKKFIENIEITYGFHTTDFIYISSMSTSHLLKKVRLTTGRNVIDCRVENVPLTSGVYAIRIGVFDNLLTKIFYGETLKIFTVRQNGRYLCKIALPGLIDIPATWCFETEKKTNEVT